MKKKWPFGACLLLLMMLLTAQAQAYTCTQKGSVQLERSDGCGSIFIADDQSSRECNADHSRGVRGNGDGTHYYYTYHKYSGTYGDLDTLIRESTEACTLEFYNCTATCTQAGYNIYRCSVCHSLYQGESVAALGHDYPDFWNGHSTTHHYKTCRRGCGVDISALHQFSQATCIAYATCECGAFLKSQGYGPHRFDGERETVVEPTCTGWGEDIIWCSVCQEVSIWADRTKPLGHIEVIDSAVAAGCESTGLTEGKHCSRCGETLIAQEEVAALGHTEKTVGAVAPTCTAAGKSAGKICSVCGAVLSAQKTVPALCHTEKVTEAVDAACTREGKTAGKECTVCGQILAAQEIIPAKGHFYRDWLPAGEHLHTAACLREFCAWQGSAVCTLYEVKAGEEIFFVCPVCGKWNQGVFASVAATAENVDAKAIPYGELVVRLLKTPFGTEETAIAGLAEKAAPLYALTAAYESAGEVHALRGRVKISLPVDCGEKITLLCLAGETWQEIPCTLESGVLSFETNQFGLFLLLPVQ